MRNYNLSKFKVLTMLLFVTQQFVAQINFVPTDISGLKLWLTGDSCKLNNSQLIDTVYDLSGNANHAIQPNTAYKPIINSTYFNGHKTILFDGAGDYIAFNSINDIRTVFWVIKSKPLTNDFTPLLGHTSLYDFHGETQGLISTSFASFFVINGTLSLNYSVVPVNAPRPNDYSLLSLTTAGNVSADNFSIDRLALTRSWNGELAELIIYNQVLTNTQITQIQSYLSSKYDPPIDLGTDLILNNTFCNVVLKDVKNNPYKSYLWNTGATTPTISVSQNGVYSVTVTSVFGKTYYDTISVTYPIFNAFQNSTLCTGNSLKWNTNLSKTQFSFAWQDNSTDSLFTIIQAGNYYATITDNFGCSINTNTITITEDSFETTTNLGNDISLCEGNSISLQTNTTSASTYTWNDGSHNSHLIINTTGEYHIAVTNTNNCLAKDTIQVSVLGQAPSVNFNASVGCRNSAVSFTNLALAPTGNTITSTYWNFGNIASPTNTTNSTNPTHTYLDTGMYVVSLIINTNVGCSNSVSQSIHIAPTPTVNFVNGISCQNDSTAFASIISSSTYPITNKLWNFGDISSAAANTSTLSNPKHLFSNQLNYTTRLVAINSAGCKDSVTKVIAVKAQVKADFNYSSACSNALMKFTDNSIVPVPNNTNIRQWNFATSTASGTLINQFYTLAAVYPVTLTVIGNNGCNSSTVKQVTVTAPPVCNFPIVSNFCLSDSVLLTDASTGTASIQQWNWSHNSALYSTQPSVYFKHTTSGNQTIKLKVTDSHGCKDSLTKTVSINPLPIVSFTTTPNDVFANSTFTLTANTNSYTTYNWLGANTFSSNLTSPFYTFTDTGKYVFSLQVIDINGCKNKQQQAISVNQKRTDLGILELTPILKADSYLALTAQLANLGNATITQFKLKITLQNGSQIQETWLGNLTKGAFLNYEVTDILANNNAKNGILCATISEINNISTDDNLTNNYLCTEVSPNGISIYEPYPNPSADDITFPIAVKNDATVLIELTNTLGELVIQEQKNATKGLNFERISLYGLAKGAYLAKLTIGEKIFIKKIMKN